MNTMVANAAADEDKLIKGKKNEFNVIHIV